MYVYVQVVQVDPDQGYLQPGRGVACKLTFHAHQPPCMYSFNLLCSGSDKELALGKYTVIQADPVGLFTGHASLEYTHVCAILVKCALAKTLYQNHWSNQVKGLPNESNNLLKGRKGSSISAAGTRLTHNSR